MENVKQNEKGKFKINSSLIFYCLLMIWPVAQFLVFYIGVNGNSILMAFQKISYVDPTAVGANGGATVSQFTLENFSRVLKWFAGTEFRKLIGVSIKFYLLGLVVGVPLGLFFSYYIYKKCFGAGFFKVMLFLPSILSGIVMGTIYRFLCSDALPELIGKITGEIPKFSILNENSGHSFLAVFFFNTWIGFGTTVLMYSNRMSGIDTEITEAAHIDGATGLKEFWHISLPHAWPTISTFLLTGFAGICSNQQGLYSLYGGSNSDPAIRNMGYYLFVEVVSKFSNGGVPQLPYYSAMSVIITLAVVPLTFLVRKGLEKFGPSED